MAGILIVDDSAVIRLKLRQLCERFHHRVVAEAPNGAAGVLFFKHHRPDLVFMDMEMPELNGLQAAQQILAADPAARIIMVTSSSDNTRVCEAITLGVKGYILKPSQDDRVFTEIQRVLAL